MQDFEKLGVFYLGREYDVERGQAKDNLILYDSKDLVTHAVCVGMTGSGKTGLCVDLIEEAAIDGIPAILIDPKGDLADLLLTFPELRAQDFLPWINADDAARKGLSEADFAAQEASAWKTGLAKWGQDGARIQRLKDAADFSIYTPGSSAGMRVSILRSFAAPPEAQRDDREAMRDRISATATALLGLLGIDADPVKSREHILLSNIFDQAWKAGQDLDLGSIIQRIQRPPFQHVGVIDVEAFYPAQDRFALAMSLNNLLASPGFEAWLQGEPLDIGAMLRTAAGKPRVTIFSIAHLNDTERMFFVTLLLNEVLNWTRAQTGTTSLRALVYMDEIYGYFPPVRNPPSKGPLLTLLKQARAFGVGVVLATQNPVDLDYKGLSNAGTWFVGRLQTERDKARLLDGLEGAAEAVSAHFDRARMDKVVSSLGARVFVMNNVHEEAPVVFESRWALSYLRGPLTRAQIKTLMEARVAAPAEIRVKQTAAPAPAVNASQSRPAIPPTIKQVFLGLRGPAARVVYHPAVLGSAQIHFIDDKSKLDQASEVTFLTPITDEAVAVKWENATEVNGSSSDFENDPVAGVAFADLPAAGAKAKNYDDWKKAFTTWIFANQKVELLRSPSSSEVSKAGESEREFRARLQQAAREERDASVESLRKHYAPKLAAAEERIRRAQQELQREQEQASSQRIQTAISVGGAILGAFFGRKTLSRTNITAAGTAARSVGRTYKEGQDVNRATETVGALQQQYTDLQEQLKQETSALQARTDPSSEAHDKIVVRPKKTNITIRLFALAWAPYRPAPDGRMEAAWE